MFLILHKVLNKKNTIKGINNCGYNKDDNLDKISFYRFDVNFF